MMDEKTTDQPDLDTLLGDARERIDRIDDEVLRLLAARKEVVDEVAQVKKTHGLPIYHPSREEDLISQRRKEAASLGLDSDSIEDIYRTVLRGSRITQTASMAGKAVRPDSSVLLVGGKGSMGQCLGGWFTQAGYEVRVLDREDWDRAETLCKDVDLALLAVPITVTEATAQRLAPLLPKGCILADITSTKTGPMKAMLAAHDGPVLGLHPMFGPTTQTLDKQIVVVNEGRDPRACRWVVEQMAAWGAVIVTSSAEEHDAMMDVVQGLRHFASFSFGQFLQRMNVDLARTLEFSSPIYRLELGMVGRLFAQDPALYADIIFSTPQRMELIKGYLEGLQENVRIVEEGDREAFLAEFRKVAEYFGPFGDQAIRESSFLIEKMIERF
jgi:chorismate mutase/prephenate dehydrogenase